MYICFWEEKYLYDKVMRLNFGAVDYKIYWMLRNFGCNDVGNVDLVVVFREKVLEGIILVRRVVNDFLGMKW